MPRLALALAAALALACAHRSTVHPRAAEELRRGYAHVAAGDLERAEVAFEHALAFRPDLPEGHAGLGVVARLRGDLAAARRHHERAVRLEPEFAEGWANLGETLLALGRHEDAVRALRGALAIDPDLSDARENLVRALIARGLEGGDRGVPLLVAARREALHVLEADPGRASAHHDLAFLAWRAGDLHAAAAGYRRALELEPSDARHAVGLCAALVGLARCEEAATACGRCLALSPSEPACREGRRRAEACR
ncbi:MAG: tetratricopeptide repeat protein [Anaeromyxobacter sp.]